MESCLIGKSAVINSKCRLTHCTVEGGYDVSKNTEAKNEIFQGFELDTGFENDMSVVDDDDDEFSDEEESEYSDGQGESDDDGLFDRS